MKPKHMNIKYCITLGITLKLINAELFLLMKPVLMNFALFWYLNQNFQILYFLVKTHKYMNIVLIW